MASSVRAALARAVERIRGRAATGGFGKASDPTAPEHKSSSSSFLKKKFREKVFPTETSFQTTSSGSTYSHATDLGKKPISKIMDRIKARLSKRKDPVIKSSFQAEKTKNPTKISEDNEVKTVENITNQEEFTTPTAVEESRRGGSIC